MYGSWVRIPAGSPKKPLSALLRGFFIRWDRKWGRGKWCDGGLWLPIAFSLVNYCKNAMSKKVKLHHFTVDERYQVIQRGGESIRQPELVSDGALHWAFPHYKCPDLENEEARGRAETRMLEEELVRRLQYGFGYPFEPSHAQNNILLDFHYENLTSHNSRKALVAHLQVILKAAIKTAEYNLVHPSAKEIDGVTKQVRYNLMDFVLEKPDLLNRHELLKYALERVVAWHQELNKARYQKKGPTKKVLVLAYRLLLDVDKALISDEIIPASYKAPDKSFAEFVTIELERKWETKCSHDSVYKYLTTHNENAGVYIYKTNIYDESKVWIMKQWPQIQSSDIPSLRKVM